MHATARGDQCRSVVHGTPAQKALGGLALMHTGTVKPRTVRSNKANVSGNREVAQRSTQTKAMQANVDEHRSLQLWTLGAIHPVSLERGQARLAKQRGLDGVERRICAFRAGLTSWHACVRNEQQPHPGQRSVST